MYAFLRHPRGPAAPRLRKAPRNPKCRPAHARIGGTPDRRSFQGSLPSFTKKKPRCGCLEGGSRGRQLCRGPVGLPARICTAGSVVRPQTPANSGQMLEGVLLFATPSILNKRPTTRLCRDQLDEHSPFSRCPPHRKMSIRSS